MKLKLLLVIWLAAFGAIVSADRVPALYTIENKIGRSIAIGYCFKVPYYDGNSQIRCRDGLYGVNEKKDFYNSPEEMVSIYWSESRTSAEIPSKKGELQLNYTGSGWFPTRFTVNPDGTISGSN